MTRSRVNAARISVVCVLAVLAGSCGGEPEGPSATETQRRETAVQFAHAVLTERDVGQAMGVAIPELQESVSEQVDSSFTYGWQIVGIPRNGCPFVSIAVPPLPKGPCFRFRLRSAIQADPGDKQGLIMRGLLMVAVTSETSPPKVTAFAFARTQGSFVKLP